MEFSKIEGSVEPFYSKDFKLLGFTILQINKPWYVHVFDTNEKFIATINDYTELPGIIQNMEFHNQLESLF